MKHINLPIAQEHLQTPNEHECLQQQIIQQIKHMGQERNRLHIEISVLVWDLDPIQQFLIKQHLGILRSLFR